MNAPAQASPGSRGAATDAVERACAVLGPLARRNHPLGPLTTYRVGGSAAVAVVVATLDDVTLVGEAVVASGLAVLVVGRGSNLLVADAGFHGLAVIVAQPLPGATGHGIALDGPGRATNGHRTVTALAGVSLPVLARRTVAGGLTGLEWAVGVPGSVGGGVRMNAGGHGSDIASSLVSACVADLRTGVVCDRRQTTLGLRFRGSDLADHELVWSADFVLALGDRARCEAELTEIVRWRREHQPGGQNAGSVFVNPIPGVLSAGQVIDELGLRGLRLGSAEISPKHANFIQADDGGSAADVRALMALVQERVRQKRGIDLRSEIRLVGFDVARGG